MAREQATVLGMSIRSLGRFATYANAMCTCVGSAGALFHRTLRRVFKSQFDTLLVSYRIRSAYSRYAWYNPYRYRTDDDDSSFVVTSSAVSLQEMHDLSMGYSDGSRAKIIKVKIAWSSSGMFCLSGIPMCRGEGEGSCGTHDVPRRAVPEQR